MFITFLQFRTNARTGIEMSRWDLYKQISVLLVVLLIAPSIIYTNSKMANSSEVRFFEMKIRVFLTANIILNFFFHTKSFIRELASKSHQIYQEKRRGEKLLTKLLPKMIATNLKDNKV